MNKNSGPKDHTLKKIAHIIFLMDYKKMNSVITGEKVGHKRNYVAYLYGQGKHILEKGEEHKSFFKLQEELNSIKNNGGI